MEEVLGQCQCISLVFVCAVEPITQCVVQYILYGRTLLEASSWACAQFDESKILLVKHRTCTVQKKKTFLVK